MTDGARGGMHTINTKLAAPSPGEAWDRPFRNGKQAGVCLLAAPLLVVERDETLAVRPNSHMLRKQRRACGAACKEAEREDHCDSCPKHELHVAIGAVQLNLQRPRENPLHDRWREVHALRRAAARRLLVRKSSLCLGPPPSSPLPPPN